MDPLGYIDIQGPGRRYKLKVGKGMLHYLNPALGLLQHLKVDVIEWMVLAAED